MNKRLIAILFLLLLLFSLFPVSSSFIVGPGVVYIVTNGAGPDEFYEMDRNLDFNNITLETYWVSFNAVGFNLSGNNVMWVNLSQIAPVPKTLGSDHRVIAFNVSAAPGTFTKINLSGLRAQHWYRLYNETGSADYAIYIRGSNTIASGNTIEYCDTYGICLYDENSKNIISNNIIHDVVTYGIYSYTAGCNNVTYNGNIIYNVATAIGLRGGDNNTIIGNKFGPTVTTGVVETAGANYNLIANNNFKGCNTNFTKVGANTITVNNIG